MVETLIVLKCEASLLGGSYQIRLERRYNDEPVSYALLYENGDGYVDSKSHYEIAISEQQVEQWFTDLSHASVPVVNRGFDGCDGVIYQLNFYQGLNSSRYQWWCEAPESYRPLVDFANQLLEAVGEKERLEVADRI